MSGNFEELRRRAKEEYIESGSLTHGWTHIEHVLANARRLNREKEAEDRILLPACILHDLGRTTDDPRHEESLKPARRLLNETGYAIEDQKRILECIASHATTGTKKPMTLEAKILFDADKLDSYGAVGIFRFFQYSSELHVDIREGANDAYERITCLSETADGFYTSEARRIGLDKVKIAFVYYYVLFMELGDYEKIEALKEILLKRFGWLRGTLILHTLHKYLT